MRPGEIVLCTFQGDTNVPPITYVAEIRYVDLVGRTFDCDLAGSGLTLTVDYSPDVGLPWPAVDPSGTSYILETHDIYVPEDASPAQDDVALLSFGDGSRALAFVESISATTNLQLYEQPYPRMSLSIDRITASEWDAHPAGEIVLALQRCYRDNAVPAEEVFGVFAAGWWSLATRRDAHAGRVGGAIDPFATVVHTADQPAETWETLLTRWTTIAGVGSCTHFAIGRSAAEGVVQLVPIDRNANHAGGDGHGAFVTESQSWHPNSVSVGIEIHCTGAIRQVDRAWRFYEDGAPHGLPIPEEDVIPDPARPGRGWHRVTDYQYEQLGALLDGLDATLRPLPANCVAQSIDPPPAYGVFADGRVVGHVSLTAARRGDPWPPTCDWIRAR